MLTLLAQADSAPTGGWQAIQDNGGLSLSITGMLIVFVALTLISLFIAMLPKVLDLLEPVLPRPHHPAVRSPDEQLPADEEKIVAAIGYVLRSEMQKAGSK